MKNITGYIVSKGFFKGMHIKPQEIQMRKHNPLYIGEEYEPIYEELPEIENIPFYIKFEKDWWKKGDIITHISQYCQEKDTKLKILRVYTNTWWRRFLLKLGFKIRILEVKVIKQ